MLDLYSHMYLLQKYFLSSNYSSSSFLPYSTFMVDFYFFLKIILLFTILGLQKERDKHACYLELVIKT